MTTITRHLRSALGGAAASAVMVAIIMKVNDNGPYDGEDMAVVAGLLAAGAVAGVAGAAVSNAR